MKSGIIGLPQVGKTSLFGILTKVRLSEHAFSNPREAHIGVAKVPDERLDKLAALYHPKKLTHASVEYVDVGAIGQDALKESAYIGHLRQVDALIHVLRAFENDAIPHVGAIDPLRDIKNVEFDLIISDLGQVEKRLERLEKDLKKGRTSELEREQALLLRSKEALEQELPLRELEMTADENFIIDKHPDYDNVWIAGGGSGHGFKHGPVIGEYVADRVSGDPGDPELRKIFALAGRSDAEANSAPR